MDEVVKPRAQLLDPSWRYTRAEHTDIAVTFDRLRPGWRAKRKLMSQYCPRCDRVRLCIEDRGDMLCAVCKLVL